MYILKKKTKKLEKVCKDGRQRGEGDDVARSRRCRS